jgi:hypothetical protein
VIVRWLEGFGRFWWDFLVGDDWTIAATVVVALAAAYGLDQAGVASWWLVPAAGMLVVVVSLRRRG